MITLSSVISNYTWAIISFFSASGLLWLGVNAYIKTKKSLTKRMRILRVCGIFSFSSLFYSISIANYLLDAGYDKFSSYFMILAAILVFVIILLSILFKVVSRRDENVIVHKKF